MLCWNNRSRQVIPVSDYKDAEKDSYLFIEQRKTINLSDFQLIAESDYFQIYYKQ
jgi:hypothetical protein